MSVSHTFFEDVKIGCKFFSANVALGACLEQSESRRREEEAARETVDEKLAETSSTANELAELRKRQATSAVSVQELTANLKEVK